MWVIFDLGPDKQVVLELAFSDTGICEKLKMIKRCVSFVELEVEAVFGSGWGLGIGCKSKKNGGFVEHRN